MKNKYLLTFLLTIAFVAASSAAPPTAAAIDPPPYGNCGDGVVEVNPYAGANDPAFSVPQPYSAPSSKGYFYVETALSSYLYLAQGASDEDKPGTWPRTSGEQCDGLESTELCTGPNLKNPADNKQCMLDKKWPDNSNNCYYNRDGSERKPRLCNPGVGNGIIQPATYVAGGINFDEECDDGNINDGDGCNSFGKYELGEAFAIGVCGNGVKDIGEDCDDGNNRNGDGCSGKCMSETAPPTATCESPSPCGNGRIDYALGEQCDNGDKNGIDKTTKKPKSNCSENCLLYSSPYFSEDNTAWWPVPNNVGIDSGSEVVAFDNKTVPVPANPKDDLGMFKFVRSSSDPTVVYEVVKIENHGQKIYIPRVPAQQNAGVFLSNQKIDDLKKKDVYKDGKIHFNMVVSMSTDYKQEQKKHDITRWDDDAFGIVFGMEPKNQSDVATKNPDYKYFMLSWRSYQLWAAGWVSPGCKGDPNGKSSLPGKPGLRLYQVSGSPSYTQLWTMRSDCMIDSSNVRSKGNIKEIPTDNTDGWVTTGGMPWQVGEDAWNRIVNPFLPLNTFYALDFGIGQPGMSQRLQIDAEFSMDELKVWVNRQPAIHITREALERAYNGKVKWPTEGQLGFYIMGMDNLTIDTSGTFSSIMAADKSGNRFNPDKFTSSSSCKDFCGNGIVETGETCDDGNTVDYDGCDSKCQPSDSVGDGGGTCKTVNGEKLCYGGTIDRPKKDSTVTSPSPNIGGTYTGATENIIVEVTNAKGVVVCKGSVREGAVIKKEGRWTLKKCVKGDGSLVKPDLENGDYNTTATFVPPQSPKGNTFPSIDAESGFTVEKKDIWLDVEEPTDGQEVSGQSQDLILSAESNATSVTAKLCVKGTTTCGSTESLNQAPDGSWQGEVSIQDPTEPDLEKCRNGAETCEVIFTAEKGGKSIEVKRDITFVNPYGADDLPASAIQNLKNNQEVIPNADHTIPVQGVLENAGTSFENKCLIIDNITKEKTLKKECEPLRVKLTVECTKPATAVNEKTYFTTVNEDLTFDTEVPVVPEDCTNVFISSITVDKNGLEKTGTNNVNLTISSKVPIPTPKISFTCPTPNYPTQECKLIGDKEGDGLVVAGQTNIPSQRPVVVKAYKKSDPNAPCKMSELKKDAPVATTTVRTTNEGKWSADIDKLPSGDYCIVADLKSQDGSKTLATTVISRNGYKNQRGSIGQETKDQPYFVANGPNANTPDKIKAGSQAVGAAVSEAIKAGKTMVPVSIAIDDPKSNVRVDDLCNIWVEGDSSWMGVGKFALVDGKLVCKAEVPIYKDGKSIAGKTLVGVAKEKVLSNGPDKVSKLTDPGLKVPSAEITVSKKDGTNGSEATITLGSDYPANPGDTITFTDKDGNEVGSCTLLQNRSCSSNLLHQPKDPTKLLEGKDIAITANVDGDPVPAFATFNPADPSSTPEEGTTLAGGGPVTGTVVYNTDETVKVTNIHGAKAGDTIILTPSYNGVSATPVTCKVTKVGAYLECDPDPDPTTGKKPIIQPQLPSGESLDKIVAETPAGVVVDTWYPKGTEPTENTKPAEVKDADKKTKVTTTYDTDGKVVVTIPKIGIGKKLKVGETVVGSSAADGGKPFSCNLEDKGDYWACTSDAPYVDGANKPFRFPTKVTINSGDTGKEIGTSYLGGQKNVTAVIPANPGNPVPGNPGSGSGVGGNNNFGLVAGGCGCSSSDAPASGLLSLLLAALGLFAIRRRRD